MKALSNFNLTILLSAFVVLPICNSTGNIDNITTPTPLNPILTPIETSTPLTYEENILYSFAGGKNGANPYAGLIQGSDGNFYGTTQQGGENNNGTVFKITPQGVKTTFYSFAGGTTDGATPKAGLIQGSDSNFYGTTFRGGAKLKGTVFKLTPQGQETVLYSFAGEKDGEYPYAGLIQDSHGNFYGTTKQGGESGAIGYGTVFRITPAGVESPLYSFAGEEDGAYPTSALIKANDSNFYGTTSRGGGELGTIGSGTVFKITPLGVKTTLYSFVGGTDGTFPEAGLIQGSDGNFYGTTSQGGESGANGNGTVFKLTSQGQETVLYRFTGVNDGALPYAGLIQGKDGNFYGTTTKGSNPNCPVGCGVVFRITPAGVESPLYSFAGGKDGANPYAGLIQDNNGNFYGTTTAGGGGDSSNGYGIVFKLSINQ